MTLMIIFIVCLVISSILVNFLQRLWMNFIGAKAMIFKRKTKLFIIIIVAFFLCGFMVQAFGIELPK
jgi:hypothetical protein